MRSKFQDPLLTVCETSSEVGLSAGKSQSFFFLTMLFLFLVTKYKGSLKAKCCKIIQDVYAEIFSRG